MAEYVEEEVCRLIADTNLALAWRSWENSRTNFGHDNPLQSRDSNLRPQKYDARVILSEPQRLVTLLITVIGHGLITTTVCFLLNNHYIFKLLLYKRCRCFTSGSTVLFTAGLYVIFRLLSGLAHEIEFCRVKKINIILWR